MTVKEKILEKIKFIDNKDLLNDVYEIIQDLIGLSDILVLNDQQITLINKGQEEFRIGKTHNHEKIFRDLLSEK